jgi:exonuclease VII large subunit
LNTTVIGNDQSRDSFLTGEVALLSLKAEAIHKEFLELNESLSADVSRLDTSLAAVWSELNAQSASEIEKNVGRMEAIQASLKTYFAERFAENESVVKALSTNFQSIDCGTQLKLSEQNLETILNASATLLDSVSDFSPAPTRAAEPVSTAHALPSSDNAPPAEHA